MWSPAFSRTFGTMRSHTARSRESMKAEVKVRPAVATRYRCSACGNLTRFDVTVTRRTRAFHHYSIGGELSVEDTEVLSEVVEEVACRWSGSGARIRTPEDPDPSREVLSYPPVHPRRLMS